MQYIHSDLGSRRRGEVVEVTLQGSRANVLLLDSSNYSAFRSGRAFRGVGGLAKRSPVHLTIPRSTHWYAVAYIPGGYRGRVRAGFRVLPGALPPIRDSAPSPLGAIREAADEYAGWLDGTDTPDRAFDLFICHAGDDKEAVARPLAHALGPKGRASPARG